MLRLEMFGGLTLTSGEEERPQPRRRLALLARLATAGARGVSRDELLALFWPERDSESARHSLDQLLYEARRALGASPTLGTASLRLDPEIIACDVAEWSAAIERDELEAAASVYSGPFLHGFYLSGSPEFDQWVEATRAQFAAEHRRVLETLATRAAAERHFTEALAWWRRLAAEDRFGSRTALGLMRALVDAGDRAGALEFARVHERILRAELESAPDPAVVAFADALRAPAPRSGEGTSAATAAADLTRRPEADAADRPPASLEPDRRVWRRPSRTAQTYFVAAALALVAALSGAVVLGRPRTTAPGASVPPTRTPLTHAAFGPSRARNIRYETTNIAAHEFYERGYDPALIRSDSGVRVAIGYLNRAVAMDTTYAAAYAALASMYTTAASSSTMTTAERRVLAGRAEAAARRAIALDDSLADAHAEIGYVFLLNHAPTAAAAELERAVALDPSSTSARELLAKAYEWTGRRADAIAVTRLADPLSASARAELGDALFFAGRYNEALAELGKVTAIQPPLRRVPVYIAEVYEATGRWSDAIAILRPVARRQTLADGLFGYALARSGARAEAMRMLKEMLADEAVGRARASGIAEVYAGLGDYDRAFVWLDRSFDDYSLRAEIMSPLFDDLRADPRFDRVRRRLGLAH